MTDKVHKEQPAKKRRPPRNAKFRGVKVNRKETQATLDEMEQGSRVFLMQEDMEYKVTDRLDEMIDVSKHYGDKDIKDDAKALLQEWGKIVGLPDLSDSDEDDDDILDWVTEEYLRKLHKQKRSINYLLENDD